jgi:hypothetical protein
MLTPEEDIALLGRSGWPNPAAGVVSPNDVLQLTSGVIGVAIDPSKGHVDFNAGQLNGGKVTVVGGTAATEWYLANGTPALVSGLDGGVLPAAASLYGFAYVEPGTVTFRAEKNGAPCEWDPVAWAGTEPGTVTVPVRAARGPGCSKCGALARRLVRDSDVRRSSFAAARSLRRGGIPRGSPRQQADSVRLRWD